jgi:hypothetical protein
VSPDEIDVIVERGGDADDVLRGVVEALAARPGVAWSAVRFLEEGRLVLGPAAGEPEDGHRTSVPISFRGDPVGELVVDGEIARSELERVAALVAPYVLLGWDTGGEAWEP